MKTIFLILLSLPALCQTRTVLLGTGSGSAPAGSTTYTLTAPSGTTVAGQARVSLVRSTTATVSIPFSVTAPIVSVGIYTADSVLVKTLIQAKRLPLGMNSVKWDRTTNEGTVAPTGGVYYAGVVAHNLKADWQGTVGNNSRVQTGQTVHRALYPPRSMVYAGGHVYVVTAYNEASPSMRKFAVTSPRDKINVLHSGGTGIDSWHVASDGSRVYYAGVDPYAPSALQPYYSFVMATTVGSDAEYTFSGGTAYTASVGHAVRPYVSVINTINQAGSRPTGIAVQQAGGWLYVARGGLNQLSILNKTTGALSATATYTNCRAVCVDNSDNVWMATGTNTVTKYSVNAATGALTATATTLSGLVNPLALAVSPDGATIAVADGGTSQQVKFFSTSSGAQTGTLGTTGGYSTSPAVTSTKFMFEFRERTEVNSVGPKSFYSFIAYEPDGSFWLGDPGNYRTLHFSAANTYLDQICYIGILRTVSADANAPTRVFADYLEYAVDYSKPLDGNNGSWTLANNWSFNIPTAYDTESNRFKYVVTLSNNRTYALTNRSTAYAAFQSLYELVELTTTGTRLTGITVVNDGTTALMPDGSLRSVTPYALGQPCVWSVRPLTGFDGSNNPTWGASVPYATSPPATANDPISRGYGMNLPAVQQSSVTGAVVSFEGITASNGSAKYHLGFLRGNRWLSRVAPNLGTGYTGNYPTDGSYDLGNGTNYPGGYVVSSGRLFVWSHHGEFWKDGQTNMMQMVWDNGLYLGQFGTVRIGNNFRMEALPGMAGNNVTGAMVQVGSDLYYYHSDESAHSGIHRWKITGYDTIYEQRLPVVKP